MINVTNKLDLGNISVLLKKDVLDWRAINLESFLEKNLSQPKSDF